MANFIETFRELGSWSLPFAALYVLALAVAGLGSVGLLAGWRVPPGLVAAGLVAPLGLAAVQGLVGRDLTEALRTVDPAEKAQLMASAVGTTLALRTACGLVVLPAALVLLAGGLGAALRGPRGFAVAGVAALVGGLEVLLGAVDAGATESPVAGAFTLAAALAAALLVAAGVGAPGEKNGGEAAGGACVAFLVAAAAAWGAIHATAEANVFRTLAVVSADQKSELAARGLAELGMEPWLGLGAVGLALAPLVAIAIVCRDDGRTLGHLVIAAGLALPAPAYVVMDPFAAQVTAIMAAWR